MSKKEREQVSQEFRAEYEEMQQIIRGFETDTSYSEQGFGDKKELASDMKAQYQKAQEVLYKLRYEPPQRSVDYALKSLEKHVAGGFDATDGTIHFNLPENIPQSFATYMNTGGVAVHEVGHRDLNETKINELPMGLAQRYQVARIDEITQKLKETLAYRQRLRQAKTEEERQEVINNSSAYFSEYQDAINKGIVNPFSDNPKDFQEEMKFIFDSNVDHWMKYTSHAYKKQCMEVTKAHFESHKAEDLAPNDANYELYKKTAFTIGGYDFSQFADRTFDEKIKCDEKSILLADRAIASGTSYDIINKRTFDVPDKKLARLDDKKEALDDIIVPKVRTDMSLSEQYELATCQALAEEIKKHYAKELTEAGDNPKEVKKVVEKAKDNIIKNVSFEKFIEQYSTALVHSGEVPASDPQKLKEELKAVCTINGVDFSKDLKNDNRVDYQHSGYFNMDQGWVGSEYMRYFEKQSIEERINLVSKFDNDVEKYKKKQQTERADLISKIQQQELEYKNYLHDESWIDKNIVPKEKNKKSVASSSAYYGKPRYAVGEKVEHIDVIDFREPILELEYQAKMVKQKIENTKRSPKETVAIENDSVKQTEVSAEFLAQRTQKEI